jgi:diacylglycerol O-acyltransferase
MTYSHYDRLSALDATFLEIEDASVHMHVGAVGIFDARPLRDPSGNLDFERIKASAEATLRKAPRFRQRLAHVPLIGHPVWVDDATFNLSYHLRHTSLPKPGGERLLKRLAGRIMSQQLDRGKPLWEMWFVEGLAEDKLAVITKIHHSVIDGLSGIDLMGVLMRPRPDPAIEHAGPWVPSPAPSGGRLLVDELRHRAAAPFGVLRAGYNVLTAPQRTLQSARDVLEGLGEALATGMRSGSPTPLNGAIGPHRRFDWTRLDLAAVKDVKSRLGGTVNDVVLATVAGAMRRYLRGRGLRVEGLDFRTLVPVSVRTEAEHGALGNRVSFLVARLPLEERDPRARLARMSEITRRLKGSKQVLGAEVLEEISDSMMTSLFARYARLGAASGAYNMVVTNVPGPQFPVYLLGAEMLASYPLVPLFSNQALGIALFSYDGGLFWGFNADWDAVPDLHDVVEAVEHEFDALANAATTSLRASA